MEDPISNLGGFFKMVLEAIQSRNWGLLIVLTLILGMSILRRFGGPIPKLGDFISSRVGGWVSLFVMSILLAAGAALMVGTPLSWGLVVSAVGVGFTAAGGYQALKDLFPLLMDWIYTRLGVDPIEVPSSGSIGKPTPQQVAAFERMMFDTGLTKQPDGSWKRRSK